MLALLALIGCADSEDIPLAPDNVVTDGGSWSLSLAPDPDPPTAGEAALVIGVVGAVDSGATESAAVTALVPWMPEHSHGITDDAVITDNGDDTFTVDWTYAMSGYWEVTITLDDGEEAVVGYEVE
ncbi:MAG: hypothetical protein ACI8RZ_006222 [Myxococcota bacterium]|jgi:hypothetical protein